MPVHIGPASLIDAYIGHRPIGEMYMGGTRIWERPRGESWGQGFSAAEVTGENNPTTYPISKAKIATANALWPDLRFSYTGTPVVEIYAAFKPDNSFDMSYIFAGGSVALFAEMAVTLVIEKREPLPTHPTLYAEAHVWRSYPKLTGYNIHAGTGTLEISGVARYTYNTDGTGTLTDLTVSGGASATTTAVSYPYEASNGRHRAMELVVVNGVAHVFNADRHVGSVQLAGTIPAEARPIFTTTDRRKQTFKVDLWAGPAVKFLGMRTGSEARARIAERGLPIPTT